MAQLTGDVVDDTVGFQLLMHHEEVGAGTA